MKTRYFYLLTYIVFLGILIPAQAQVNITAMEYFFDDGDRGVGQNTSIPITPGNEITKNLDIPANVMNQLSAGHHTLYIRAKDATNRWGIVDSRAFYISEESITSQAPINTLEYYFDDKDKGPGNNERVRPRSGVSIDHTFDIPKEKLPTTPGHHTLYIRALNTDNTWGIPEARPFYIDALAGIRIAGFEYFFNSDPGIGKGKKINEQPPKATIDKKYEVDPSTLTGDKHVLGIRPINENGIRGMTRYLPFEFCQAASPKFTANTVCFNTATTFTDQSSDLATDDKYSWDFDGDGNEDSDKSGKQTYTYKKAGTFKAKLTIKRAGCDASYTADVIVTPQPTPNAGKDQTICGNKVILNAVPPKKGERGLWGIYKGTGSIENENNHDAIFTSTSSEATLRWKVTNTLGGCSKSDDVVITKSQSITANPTNSKVKIGQSITSSILSKAKGNITTTIIDPKPKKGKVKVLPSGEITYTPYPKTLGKDTVRYQLKNQCKKTATSYWVIDIINSAPTIKQPTVKVTKDRKRSIDLPSLISDPNDNLDLSTLQIVKQPKSGAKASISPSHQLLIDYTGVTFRGRDELTVKVCDTKGACAEQVIFIEVDFEPLAIIVYNAVSPNGDNKHDFLEIENIDSYKGNKVVIFSRWGDVVFKTENYNNTSNFFKGKSDSGKDLPSGTYYYTIDLNNGKDPIKGFVLLNK